MNKWDETFYDLDCCCKLEADFYGHWINDLEPFFATITKPHENSDSYVCTVEEAVESLLSLSKELEVDGLCIENIDYRLIKVDEPKSMSDLTPGFIKIKS